MTVVVISARRWNQVSKSPESYLTGSGKPSNSQHFVEELSSGNFKISWDDVVIPLSKIK